MLLFKPLLDWIKHCINHYLSEVEAVIEFMQTLDRPNYQDLREKNKRRWKFDSYLHTIESLSFFVYKYFI